MDYSMRKQSRANGEVNKINVRYEKKEDNGRLKSCLIFSLKPRTAMGAKRIRINHVSDE